MSYFKTACIISILIALLCVQVPESFLLAEDEQTIVDELMINMVQKAPNRVCPFTIDVYPTEISLGMTQLRYEYDEIEKAREDEKVVRVNDIVGDVVYVKVTFKNRYDEPASALGVPLMEYDDDGKIWCWIVYDSKLYEVHYTLPVNMIIGAMMGGQHPMPPRRFFDTTGRVWKTLQPGESATLYFAFELNPWLFCNSDSMNAIHRIGVYLDFLDFKDLNVFSNRLPPEIVVLRDANRSWFRREKFETELGLSFTTNSIFRKTSAEMIVPTKRQEIFNEFRQCDLPLFESGEDSIPIQSKENYSVFAEKLYAFAPVVLKGASKDVKTLWKELYRRDFMAERYTFQQYSGKRRGVLRLNNSEYRKSNDRVDRARKQGVPFDQIDFFENHYDWKVEDFDPSLFEKATESQRLFKSYIDFQVEVLSFFNDESDDSAAIQKKLDELDAYLKSVPEIPRGFFKDHIRDFLWECEVDWKSIIEEAGTYTLGTDARDIFDGLKFEVFQLRSESSDAESSISPDERKMREDIEESVKARNENRKQYVPRVLLLK